MRLRELVAAALLVLLSWQPVMADPVDLKPFKATYLVDWKGVTAGQATLELRKGPNDTYTYGSENKARGVFRMAFPEAITQTSTFRVIDGRVVAQSFRGADEKERPIELDFDWQARRVRGQARGNPVDLELPDRAHDPMSLQISALRDLASDRIEEKVWLLDGDKLKEYELRREGTARIETALGELDTVIYTSRRAGGDRLTRTWVAPALGYLPVKAERIRKNKVEFTLHIESADR